MELNLLSLNADFVAQLLSGSVGGLLISVSLVTKGRFKETTFQERKRVSCHNVREEGIVL